MKRLTAFLVAATIVGCGTFRDPGDLRYARTLAVRAEPPRVAPGQRARIELLVTDNAGVPSVRAPDAVTVAPPLPGQPVAPAEASQLITQDNGAWYVSAPSAEILVQLRQAFGLPADSEAPIPFSVSVSVTLDGQQRPSEKVVWLGGAAGNPTITAMAIDGHPMEDNSPVAVSAAGEHTLTATAAGEGTLSYSWYTAFGELKKYREPAATFEKAMPGESGAVVLVVRNDLGGVTWRFGSLLAQ
jgi:hypothetical protein